MTTGGRDTIGTPGSRSGGFWLPGDPWLDRWSRTPDQDEFMTMSELLAPDKQQ